MQNKFEFNDDTKIGFPINDIPENYFNNFNKNIFEKIKVQQIKRNKNIKIVRLSFLMSAIFILFFVYNFINKKSTNLSNNLSESVMISDNNLEYIIYDFNDITEEDAVTFLDNKTNQYFLKN